MKRILFILSLLPGVLYSQTESEEVSHRFYLIGDAGNDTTSGQTLLNLKARLKDDPLSTVIFLGDNVYHQGLEIGNPKSLTYLKSEKKLLSQLSVVQNFGGNVYFVPGNHDWKAGKWQGLKAITKMSKYIEENLDLTSIRNKNEQNFVPTAGFPGPFTTTIADGVRIIVIDSQWGLQKQLFHPVGRNKSSRKTLEELYGEIDSLLNLASMNKELVIFAAHHPIYTIGEHNSRKEPLRFLVNYTPLQLFGLLGLNRWLIQDVHQPRYRRYRENILRLFDKYNNIIYVAGHEHNLQYFNRGMNRYIVSGSGSKISAIRKKVEACTYYNDKQRGYFIVTVYKNGKIEIGTETEDGAYFKVEKY